MERKLDRKEIRALLGWTLSYYRPFAFLTALYIICGGLIILGELMIPRRVGYLIDHVLPLNQSDALINQMIILGGIAILILISKSLFSILEVFISSGVTKTQKLDLINKLYRLGFSYYEKSSSGKLISLFENSVREIQQTYTFLFPQFIYCFAQFTVPSIILIIEEPIFFVAAMVGNIIYMFLNKGTNRKIQYYLGIETEAAHVFQQSAYDSIAAVPELSALGSDKWIIQNVISDFDKFRSSRMHSIFWRHFRFTTVGLTLAISTILFYFYGMGLIRSGELQLGEFIGYSFLMGIISRGFSVFFYIIPAQIHALNYAKDLYEFLHLEEDIKDHEDYREYPITGSDIKITNVSFSYDRKSNIVDDVTIVIPHGKKTAIVGESGSGKTTLLKLIDRFYDVQSGSVSIGDIDIRDISQEELRDNIGFVFQEGYLFDISIEDNIKLGNPYASIESVVEAAKRAGAHQFIMETELGYDTVVGERGLLLSGGQRQRISLARMFLKNPSIILLDEATAALDSVTEKAIKKFLDELSDGKTMVSVAHRLSTIMDYDNIIVMDKGKVAEQGTYSELLDMKGLFYNLVKRGAENER